MKIGDIVVHSRDGDVVQIVSNEYYASNWDNDNIISEEEFLLDFLDEEEKLYRPAHPIEVLLFWNKGE